METKKYNLIKIDDIDRYDVISRIQYLYFNDGDVRKTFKYSQMLNKLTNFEMYIKLLKDFKDLILFTEKVELHDKIATRLMEDEK